MRRRALLPVALGLSGLAALGLSRRLSARVPAPTGPELCISAPPWPYEPASGLPPEAPRLLPAQARCPVCGMYPARSPGWAAQAHFDDDAALFFDSPLMLLLWLQDVARHSPGRSAAGLRRLWVQDHLDRSWVDARRAFYVQGSDALGPMRNGNLPPFARREQAGAFAQRHGGRVLDFAAAGAPALLRALDTRHRHPA